MNKKILLKSIIISIVVIFLGIYFIKYFLDPFGAPPRGTQPNCGEFRSKFDVTINSKEDFVNFIKTNEMTKMIELDNFKNVSLGTNYEENYMNLKSAEVDWNKVLNEVKIEKASFKTIYVLDYNPFGCSGYTLKMTKAGHFSNYGCCGK